MNLNQILFIAAMILLAIAFIITVGWVDAAGNARDGWLVGGLTVFAAGHISWRPA